MLLEAGRGATGPLSIQNMLLLEIGGDSKAQKPESASRAE